MKINTFAMHFTDITDPQYGDFKNGIPVHDTIARVMSMISAKQLQKSFATWMRDCHIATEGEVIAIDGKSLRGTYNKDRR